MVQATTVMAEQESVPSERRHEEFVRLFLSQEKSIRAFVLSLVPSLHVAEDLVQQACVVMLRKFDEFKPDRDPATEFRRWACAVAHNEVRNYRRKAGRDHLVFSDELVDSLAACHMEMNDDGALADSVSLTTTLERCLAKLSEFDRRVLSLRYYKGQRGAQIAEALGRSVESIYKRIARAKERLRDCVATQLSER